MDKLSQKKPNIQRKYWNKKNWIFLKKSIDKKKNLCYNVIRARKREQNEPWKLNNIMDLENSRVFNLETTNEIK